MLGKGMGLGVGLLKVQEGWVWLFCLHICGGALKQRLTMHLRCTWVFMCLASSSGVGVVVFGSA